MLPYFSLQNNFIFGFQKFEGGKKIKHGFDNAIDGLQTKPIYFEEPNNIISGFTNILSKSVNSLRDWLITRINQAPSDLKYLLGNRSKNAINYFDMFIFASFL